MHLAISPLLLGAGENLFAGLDMPSLAISAASRWRQRSPRM
jgi:hypothetical protein